MSGLTPVFYNRQFVLATDVPRLSFGPNRYAFSRLGGPLDAEIDVIGNEGDLWRLLNLLRYGTEIVSDSGDLRWWGYVRQVEINIGAITVGISLDRMTNRVSVAYTSFGKRETTPWSENTDSIATYGYKERMITLSNATPEQALYTRMLALADRSRPMPTLRVNNNARSGGKLFLSGWYDTLSWRHFASTRETLKTSYINEPEDQTVALGDISGRARVYNTWQLPAGASPRYAVPSQRYKVAKVGNPTDAVIVELCADSSGTPGAVLASNQIAAASFPSAHGWMDIAYPSPAAIPSATTYGTQFRRTGPVDPVNYYRIIAHSALGYSSGQTRVYNGSAWVANSPDVDLLFEASGLSMTETSAMLSSIYTQAGQFFAGYTPEIGASGVYTDALRNGDQNCLVAFEELLRAGTVSGQRLMVDVTPDRRLVVKPEPVLGARDFYLTNDGRLVTSMDTPVDKQSLVVGSWARLKEVSTLGLDDLSNESLAMFIEQAEYLASGDRVQLTTREHQDAFSSFSTIDIG